MVEIEKLSFGYGKQRVFDDLTLSLNGGCVYGLLGENGAGKTTLMKLMLGLLKGDGRCEVNGYVPWRREPAFLGSVFFVPDTFAGGDESVREMADRMGAFYPGYDRSVLPEYLDTLEVPSEKCFSEMSFGQRKKGLFAVALAMNVKFLLMDEPTEGLDIPSKVKFCRLLNGWSASHGWNTLLISTHQVRDLEDVIESVVMLGKGKTLLNESGGKITRRSGAELEKLFNDIMTLKL